MSFLLDTDTCSAYLRADRTIFNRFVQHSGGLYVSMITVGELFTWVERASTGPRRLQTLNSLLSEVYSIAVDMDVAKEFGRTRAALLDRGISVPANDLFIAATALVRDFTVVTRNVRHFSLVPNLPIEDWTKP